eukprot:COSAG01_NODE_3698_length_5784_cov_5.069129_4_plen_80_part_00
MHAAVCAVWWAGADALPPVPAARPAARSGARRAVGASTELDQTGAKGDYGIAKVWNRRRISVSSKYDQSDSSSTAPVYS